MRTLLILMLAGMLLGCTTVKVQECEGCLILIGQDVEKAHSIPISATGTGKLY